MERPLERRTSTRTAVVWETVRDLFGTAPAGRTVLDIGGGTGGVAVRLAAAGHAVTVVDPSPDALAALARRAAEDDVADRITGLQGDLADLADLVPPGSADLVLCHAVLGVLRDPAERAAALAAIAGVLRPGGTLSLLVAQRHASVLARAMAGHFGQALAVLEGRDEASTAGEHRFTADEVTGLVAEAGFTVGAVQAVRVFADLVPGSLLDLEPGATAALLDLERAVASRPEYLTLGAQVHVVATR